MERVFATVENGDVWIHGKVDTGNDKQTINEIVHRIEGEIDLSGIEH